MQSKKETFIGSETLVLNANNALVQYIFEHKDSEHVPTFCKQLYDLAMIANQPLLLLKINDGFRTEEFRRLGLTGNSGDWERLVSTSLDYINEAECRITLYLEDDFCAALS